MGREKARISVVVIGHSRAGKSTLYGHLIHKLGYLWSSREKEKLEQEVHARGFDNVYAWAVDNYRRERVNGYDPMQDINPLQFQTAKSSVSIIKEPPGHRDFMSSSISGTSEQADAAMLVISAIREEFNDGIAAASETLQQVLLAYTLGVKHILILVTKMDEPTVNWSKERFDDVVREIAPFTNNGFNSRVSFIPVSGLQGDNIFEASTNLSWYKGLTLCEAFDTLVEIPMAKSLRIPVQDVYKIAGIGIVAVGRVEAGVIRRGMMVDFAPGGFSNEVRFIEMHHEVLQEAGVGSTIGFNVRRASLRDIKRGMVAGDTNDNPPQAAESFTALVIIVNHPGEIREGYSPVVDCHNAHVACKFVELIRKVDRRTGQTIEEAPKFLKSGDQAIVKLVPLKAVCVETYSNYPSLGRFSIRDMKTTVGLGVIKEVAFKKI